MCTTVGIFYADLAGGVTVFRAGVAELPVAATDVASLLPVLVRSAFAARSLTQPEAYTTLLQAAMHKNWHQVNFVFDAGGWYQLYDMLGKRGERLQCLPPTEEEIPAEDVEPSDHQIKKIYDMTKSHVFDDDREHIRAAANAATSEEAGKMIQELAEQLRIRPRQHPVGWRNRRPRP